MALTAVQSEPDEAVARGRESLDRTWGKYPWYDAENDNVKAIPIPRDWNPNYTAPTPPAWLAGLVKMLVWTMLILVVVVLVFLLIRTYARGRAGPVSQAKDNREAAEQKRRIEALPFPVQAAKHDFLAEARRYYELGQYGEAIKYLFSYQLVQLDRRRAVRLTRGKTNRQYLRELARSPFAILTRTVEQTMLVFEDSFFGGHTIDRIRFEACWSQLPQFEAQCKRETR
jgi:hypothetical protein